MTFYKNDLNFDILDKVNDCEYGLSRPIRNQEPYMRIFVRDGSKQREALQAFEKFCSKFNREYVER